MEAETEKGTQINANKVIDHLTNKLAEKERENAVLTVLLQEQQEQQAAKAKAVKQPQNEQKRKG